MDSNNVEKHDDHSLNLYYKKFSGPYKGPHTDGPQVDLERVAVLQHKKQGIFFTCEPENM